MRTKNRTWTIRHRDRCGACGHAHALDVTYRCVGCDDEVCALCVVWVRETHEGFCSACAEGVEGED